MKRSTNNGKLEVVDLDPFDFWGGEGGVGLGFSLGPRYPVGYWNKAEFKKAYWPNSGDDFGMPQPVNKEILRKLTIADLTEKTFIDDDKYPERVTISSVKFKWGTLRFPGSSSEVISKIKNIEFIDENAYFMEDWNTPGTIEIVHWQW